jgi:hypothetical protein
MDPDELGLWLHDFLDITWQGFLSRARPHARTGHITPMGPIDDANERCKVSNQSSRLSVLFPSRRPFTTHSMYNDI